jgi:hypothetical protein
MQILLHIKNAQYAIDAVKRYRTMLFKFNRKDKLLFKLLIVRMLFQKSLKSRHAQNERGSTHTVYQGTKEITDMEFLNSIFNRNFWAITRVFLDQSFYLVGFLPSFFVLQNAIHE